MQTERKGVDCLCPLRFTSLLVALAISVTCLATVAPPALEDGMTKLATQSMAFALATSARAGRELVVVNVGISVSLIVTKDGT